MSELREVHIETNSKDKYPEMKILNYRSIYDIDIQFGNEIILTHRNYKELAKWKTFNPFNKSTYGVGYLGIGKYTTIENGKMSMKYKTWRSMMKRCYDENKRNEAPTYKECSVAEEWHNFQNFGAWYDKNYYEVKGEKMALDKDIIVKGNKLYCSNNCIFVPERINTLFIKSKRSRGIYPIGVSRNKNDNLIIAQCRDALNNKLVHIGTFDTPEEAFYKGYKPFKENIIKQMANLYKDSIPIRLYNVMMNYEVEITD